MASTRNNSSALDSEEGSSETAQTEEIAELDLLDGAGKKDSALVSAADLSATVGAFAVRMQRRKKEQAEIVDSEGQLAKQRQQLLLQSMVKIRRSLEEVVRIDLGERFTLDLQKDDVHGWPRLTIRLLDSLRPRNDYPFFRVISHDRQGRGAIEISYTTENAVEALSLAKEADYKRLPMVLKKCVRDFLDRTGEIVLSAERGFDLETEEDQALPGAEVPTQPKAAVANGEEIDFFDEGYAHQDGFERLPEIDDLETLVLSRDAE